jgi:ribosomal protein S18 acetylase RimI-like enzyme
VNVEIANTGTRRASVTLEVKGNNEIAQRFYERALYIDGVAYAGRSAVIATIEQNLAKNLATQLRVPSDWDEGGRQDALFVFWTEAVD